MFRDGNPVLEQGISGKENYRFVGPAYVHVFMDGRARKWADAGKLDGIILLLCECLWERSGYGAVKPLGLGTNRTSR